MPLQEVGGAHDGLETFALVTTSLTWQASQQGICFLDLFGGIAIGSAATLQIGIKVCKYLYVDNDLVAQKVAQAHIEKLRKHYPNLLAIKATLVSFTTLAQDMLLIEEDQL